MAEESDLERTESPTARRLEKAREEGQVPQSRELTAMLITAAGVAVLWSLGPWFSQHIDDMLRYGLTLDRQSAFDTHLMGKTLMALALEALKVIAPIFIITIVAALLPPFLLGGWVISPKALALDLTRLNPLKGMARMFSTASLGELVKAILKALLLGAIAVWVIYHERGALFMTLSQPIESALSFLAHMLLFAMTALVVGLAFIAALDVPFQLWEYHKRLRMTKEEVKQEYKEMEGDPQLKARIRSQQREVARKRMMAQVPKADVVVTNPNHFAVALQYNEELAAPRVVAKGMNIIAQRIREIAQEHAIPVLETPPLARALFRHVELEQQIPSVLYTAVAQVMAYVYQLRAALDSSGQLTPPPLPGNIPIPDGLDPGAEP